MQSMHRQPAKRITALRPTLWCVVNAVFFADFDD
jgi:hypothetical protein